MAEVTDLQDKLELSKVPLRIECFDISNIQGTDMVGSLVVFVSGLPLKNDYRRFKVRSVKGKPDDVRAIYEVVKRRYTGQLARQLALPDLVMVDGGAGQVSAAKKALDEARLSLPVIGLAKREEEIYRPLAARPLKLDRHSQALLLLQRIRDEAHRFAVSFHRARRSKTLFGRAT
jgi:excinuclease ABC subunit C